MKTLMVIASVVLVCGLAICMRAQMRNGAQVGPPPSTIKSAPDSKEVERARKWLQGLTTLDLIDSTEAELLRLIPFEATRFEKDDRLWYRDGTSVVIRNGDIIGRFRVFTMVHGKVTKHEIIDRIIACALPRRAP